MWRPLVVSLVFFIVLAVSPSPSANVAAPSKRIEAAWRDLRSELRGFVRARVPSPSLADDILQDVFLRVQRKRSELEHVVNLRAWIFQVTRNVLIDHRRSHARWQLEELSEMSEQATDSTREIRERLAPCIRAMTDELPPMYGEALRLVEFDNLSNREAAQHLNISLTAVKSRVRRGRALLKKLLLDCCHFEVTADGQVQDYWRKSQSSQPKEC